MHPTPNPADILPRATYYQVIHTLSGLLPPPADDSPEAAADRDLATIEHIASLQPATPEETHLATYYVASGIWALYCLRNARRYHADTAFFLDCTTRCASMMRQAHSWRLALHRAQAERRKREAAPPPPAPDDIAEPPAGAPGAEPAAPPGDPPPATPVAAAERYALLHRKRARLIRRLGRLPDKTNIGWLPPDVVHAIVTGSSPILRALDDPPRATMAAAA